MSPSGKISEAMVEAAGIAIYRRRHSGDPMWPVGVDKHGLHQEPFIDHVPDWKWRGYDEDARAVLTAALSVPAPGTGGAEPVAWRYRGKFKWFFRVNNKGNHAGWLPLYDHPAPVSTPPAGDMGAVKGLVSALKPFASIADMEPNTPDAASTFVNISRCRDARAALDAYAAAISSSPVGEMVLGVLEAARLIDIEASEAEANNVTLKPEYLRALARSMRSRVELGIYAASPQGVR